MHTRRSLPWMYEMSDWFRNQLVQLWLTNSFALHKTAVHEKQGNVLLKCLCSSL